MEAALFVTLCLWTSVLCDGTKNITVTTGQNIALECLSPVSKYDVIELVEWSKPDLKTKKYVFFFRGNLRNGDYQDPSFYNRVELRDPEMKNGNVSVVLKNVTANDSGTYECRVKAGSKRLVKRYKPEPISIIELTVSPDSGRPHGDTGGGDKDGGNEDGGDMHGHLGLIAAACVIGVIVVPGLVLLVIRLRRKN